ncbi:MAG: type II secretion system protein [Rickettsiales bacterium]
MREKNKHGFSLIEFAIAIVIIGLILAAISVSKNLADTSRLNSVMTDMQNFQIKFNAFKQTYGQYPGDFSTASTIWPSCSYPTSDCNGNGNNLVEFDTTATPLIEGRLVFLHMSLASLWEETIPSVPSASTPATTIYNTSGNAWIIGKMNYSANAKLIATGAFTTYTNAILSNDPYPFNANINAVFMSFWSGSTPLGSPINASQAFYLDTKFDDGYLDPSGNGDGAASGMLRAVTSISGSCLTSGMYNIEAGDAATTNGCVVGYQLTN